MAAQTAHQRAYVRKTYSFAGTVLRAGSAKQLKYPLVVALVDAAAIIGDIIDNLNVV